MERVHQKLANLFPRSIMATLLASLLLILVCGETIGLFGIEGFVFVDPQAPVVSSKGIESSKTSARCINKLRRQRMELKLGLGEYSIDLEPPLGMILEEQVEGKASGVKVLEVLKDDESAGSAWKSGRVAPCEVLLEIDGTDVSKSSFDDVMEILSTPSQQSFRRIVLGDGLGQFDMPKNVVQRLETTEDAFFVDAVVREAVREIRRDGRLGDLLNVEVIVGAGVTTEDSTTRGMVRFFAIFSTDGVTTYSCNVSATGIRSANGTQKDNDPNRLISIISLSCAKDEGLGRTYDLIQEA